MSRKGRDASAPTTGWGLPRMQQHALTLLTSSAFKLAVGQGQDTALLGLWKTQLGAARKPREDGTLEFCISNEGVDRDGDSIKVEGWHLENFRRNPVVLFAHQHDQLPVGKSVELYIDGSDLISRVQFTSRDENPLGDTLRRMYLGGFMNAQSVGFQPRAWEERAAEDGQPFPGWTFTAQDLLEHSCVPVPSLPSALMRAHEAKIDTTPLRQWCERMLDGDMPAKGITVDELERAWSVRTSAPLLVEVQMPEKATATTSDNDEHTHQLELPDGEIEAGTYTTTEVEGHAHTADVPALAPGESAEVTTSETDGHTHNVTVSATEAAGEDGKATQEDAEEGAQQPVTLAINAPSVQVLERFVQALEKRGRVLSRANESKIREAIDSMKAASQSLEAVLGSLGEEESQAPTEAKSDGDVNGGDTELWIDADDLAEAFGPAETDDDADELLLSCDDDTLRAALADVLHEQGTGDAGAQGNPERGD